MKDKSFYLEMPFLKKNKKAHVEFIIADKRDQFYEYFDNCVVELKENEDVEKQIEEYLKNYFIKKTNYVYSYDYFVL